MNPDTPRVSKHPRVSLIMVKTLSTAVVNGQESPQKIPEKPADEPEEKKKEVDPASLGPDGALQYYAKVGDLEAMRKEYQKGAKVNVADRGPAIVSTAEGEPPNHAISGDYPLHMAVGGGHMPAVNELLNWEADIEAKNRIGSTALIRAISHDQLDIAKRLLKDGASISVTNKIGNTALHCAAFVGSLEGAKLLIEAQALAHINQPNLYGATPLMLAAKSSSALCKYLISLRSGKISPSDYKEEKKLENKETLRSSITGRRSGSGSGGSGEKRRSINTTTTATTYTPTETVTDTISSPSFPETRQIAAPSMAGPQPSKGDQDEQSDIELAAVSSYTTESGGAEET